MDNNTCSAIFVLHKAVIKLQKEAFNCLTVFTAFRVALN